MINPYEILGVERSATADEIKKAYRIKAKELHPDQHGGDDTKFKELGQAYDILKNPTKKDAFDSGRSSSTHPGTGSGSQWTAYHYPRPGSNPFDDPYMQARRSGMWDRPGAQSVNNVQVNAGIPLDILIHGGELTLPIQAPRMVNTGGAFHGFTMETYHIKLKIDPLMPVGSRIVVSKEDHGIAGVNNLIVMVFPEQTSGGNFRVEQLDIHVMVLADAFDALLGRQMDITLPTKEEVRVTLPVGISSGKSIRLASKGLVGLGGDRGDVYLVVSLRLPVLSDDQKHQIQQIVYPDGG